LEKALAKLDSSKVEIKINWLPFFLDPTLPSPGHDKMQHYVRKFGKRAEAMVATLFAWL